ncbi:uncharacterized protein TNCT_472931 [Trichonephila clavata]|uniref:Uncharacterized protein n=1 Tax=Trichonephila clavata TaxID=2740835 RepID=A0A8X6JPS4_TRICU|nr:uncharacterized protein TNCT_472931 [Trichonephila clavata]
MNHEETSKGDEEVQGKGRGGRKMGRGRSLSIQQSREQKSQEGTLKSDWPKRESTLKSDWSKRESTLIESAEAEGNPRDILNSRIGELEQQLRDEEDRYSRLTEETRQARELCDAERRDCEDVVFVAKRNLRRLVERILEGQHRRKALGLSIERADEDERQEQRWRAQQRALEEERLTRNVVLLQAVSRCNKFMVQMMKLKQKKYSMFQQVNRFQSTGHNVERNIEYRSNGTDIKYFSYCFPSQKHHLLTNFVTNFETWVD